MTDTTIDGYPVTEGMSVWDYDLRRVVVGKPEKYGNPAEPTWYEMLRRDGSRSSSMDAKRMWRRHPSTHEEADDGWEYEGTLGPDCYTVLINKVGGGTLGKSYSGLWDWHLSDPTGVVLGTSIDSHQLFTGSEFTHAQAALAVIDFYEGSVESE